MAETPEIELRRATEADAVMLLEWRNDPVTRANSRNTARIKPGGQHERWLQDVLADPDRSLLIAELDGESIGQVRFDRLAGDEWEISITLDPARRAQGLGALLIRSGVDWLRREVGPVPVIAEVRDSNELSMRAFRACGFTDAGRSQTPDCARLRLRN